jgi:hypothetical protein
MALIHIMVGDGDTKHKEERLVYVADVKYDIMLGRQWLADHNPQIRWDTGTIIMDSRHCGECCSTDLSRPAIALSQEYAYRSKTVAAHNIRITYRPGKLNVKADALTRRPQDEPNEIVVNHRIQKLLQPDLFVPPPPFIDGIPRLNIAATTTPRASVAPFVPSGYVQMPSATGSSLP